MGWNGIRNKSYLGGYMKIKRNQKIKVDKGILDIDIGRFMSVRGYSIGGAWGFYRNDKGEKHIFDETVHRISLV